jgi:branched-chain amino acid transport system permease protein
MMEKFLQYTISGMSQGSLYTMVALGIVLIYRSNRVLNFAQGDMATAGTFAAMALLGMNLYFWMSSLFALFVGAAIAVLFYFCVLIPAQRRDATHLGQIMLTLGIGLIIQGLILRFGSVEPQTFPFPISDTKVYEFGNVVVSQLSLGTLIFNLVASIGFYLLVQKTKLGLAMRATSENLQAAQTLGIPTRRILALSWGLAAMLGVLGGCFWPRPCCWIHFLCSNRFSRDLPRPSWEGSTACPGRLSAACFWGWPNRWPAVIFLSHSRTLWRFW